MSLVEDTKVRTLVELLYSRIAHWAPRDKQRLFLVPMYLKLKEPFGQLIVWTDSIRNVFPEEFHEVYAAAGVKDTQDRELAHILTQKHGNTGL